MTGGEHGKPAHARWRQRDIGLSNQRRSVFIRDERGATAVEFGMIAPFFFLLIMFIMSIGYMLVMTEALDYATQKAARQLKTGQVQSAGLTQAQFISQDVCPYLPSIFTCTNIIVNIQPVSTATSGSYAYPASYSQFVNSNQTALINPAFNNAQTSYCPGNSQTYVYMQILYPVNMFLSYLTSSSVATTYNGQKVYMIMSTASYRNEPFPGTSSC